MKNSKVRFIAYSAMIAAAYVALTMISAAFGLSSGAIQVRISEALCVIPIFTLSAVPGVTVGCFIANILCGGTVYDIVFGTLATLIAAVITYFIKNPLLSSIPTIVSNAVIVPIVLIMSGVGGVNMFPYFALTVGLGEVISCGILGTILAVYMKKHPRVSQALFKA